MQDGQRLQLAPVELASKREVVLGVARPDERALEYAAVELLWDREVVLQAVKQDAHTLQLTAASACRTVRSCSRP